MARIHSKLLEIGQMDRLASLDTPVHRLDPRAKLLTTLAFVATVVSFDKYELSALVPFFLYPVTLTALGQIPPRHLLRKVALVSPFAIMVGVFNPVFDRTAMFCLGPLTVTGGWVSFGSVMLRFILTVSAALVFLSCTGIHNVCLAMERLGVPRPFVVQVLFLYRYLFVLVDEGQRLVRARALRSFGASSGMRLHVYGHMTGHLLLRALDRAQRVHAAMKCRGFDGHIRVREPLVLRPLDVVFTCSWILLFVAMRAYNLSLALGNIITEVMS